MDGIVVLSGMRDDSARIMMRDMGLVEDVAQHPFGQISEQGELLDSVRADGGYSLNHVGSFSSGEGEIRGPPRHGMRRV